MYHGEKVAFGTIAQLVLEDVPMEDLEEVISFCIEAVSYTHLGHIRIYMRGH